VTTSHRSAEQHELAHFQSGESTVGIFSGKKLWQCVDIWRNFVKESM
jgi:hypothetical protein